MINYVLYTILAIALGGILGAVFGLVPYLMGKHMGKPNLGTLGFKWCIAGGLISGSTLAIPIAVGFAVAIIVKDSDYRAPAPAPVPTPAPPEPGVNTHLGITCLAGPMRGQTFPVGRYGLIVGRDHDCTVRFSPDTAGISRHHCSLRWQNGTLILTDLNSAYGTFLADGKKLPPQYPTQVAVGTRFYLANDRNLFQIVITG